MVEVTDSGKDAEPTAASSNFSKHSQNCRKLNQKWTQRRRK